MRLVPDTPDLAKLGNALGPTCDNPTRHREIQTRNNLRACLDHREEHPMHGMLPGPGGPGVAVGPGVSMSSQRDPPPPTPSPGLTVRGFTWPRGRSAPTIR